MELHTFCWRTPEGNGSLKVQVENHFIKETGHEQREENYILHLYSC